MKKFLFCFLMLAVTTVSAKTTVKVGISDIEQVKGESELYALFASNGQIYELEDSFNTHLAEARLALKNGERVILELTENSDVENVLGLRNNILNITRVENTSSSLNSKVAPKRTNKSLYNASSLLSDYITDFRSSRSVDRVFYEQRTKTRKKSQCYNRAHLWSWEMRKFSEGGRKVQPGKMWIYFTKRYISDYKYKWWFHVAPFVTLNGQDMVMDRKFLRTPVTRRAWSDFFIQPRTHCPLITRYSQYANNPYQGNCFLMRTSVHYHQPYQIENLELGHPVQRNWVEWELKIAYKDGAGKRKVPRL